MLRAIRSCALVAIATTATAADQLPGILIDTPFRPISKRFPLPDWLSYSSTRFGETEQSLITLHPRFDCDAANTSINNTTLLVTSLSIIELCETGVAAHHSTLAPCPISSTLRSRKATAPTPEPRLEESASHTEVSALFDLSVR